MDFSTFWEIFFSDGSPKIYINHHRLPHSIRLHLGFSTCKMKPSFFFQYCAVSQPQCCAVSLPQCCAVSPPECCALSLPKLFPPTSKYVLCSVPKRLDFKSLFSGKFRKNHMSEDEELPGPQRWIQVPCTLYLLTVLFLLSYCLTINDLYH